MKNLLKVHELPFAKSIFKTVEKAALENNAKHVSLVSLEVGELRDFVPELVQKYWDYISRGTICDGSKIVMTMVPITARCRGCETVYPIRLGHLQEARCPECGCDTGTMLSGRELRIMNIEIE